MNGKKFVITGGSGFVGRALGLRLREKGHEVHSISRGEHAGLREAGIIHHRLDLLDLNEDHRPIFEGSDTVFHVAAKVEMWGRYAEFFRVNVEATRNVMKLCTACGVPKLVYTSSPSVISAGSNLCGINESVSYPLKYEAYYPETKAMAEREVLAASCQQFRTLSLRPHLIFGPGDTNLVPTILERARQGRLVQVGSGANRVDLTFIEDCVEAHICASEALDSNPSACGRAYFISQGEPVLMWEWINEVLTRSGLPPVRRKVPAGAAFLLGALSEALVRFLPGKREPFLTKFLVSEMSTSHYFNIEAARRELGYSPKYTMKEAMDITFR